VNKDDHNVYSEPGSCCVRRGDKVTAKTDTRRPIPTRTCPLVDARGLVE